METKPHLLETYLVTRAEALKLMGQSIKEKADWALSVRVDGYKDDGFEKPIHDALITYLVLSRTQAKRIIQSMISDHLEIRGVRIMISKYQFTIHSRITYWITQR